MHALEADIARYARVAGVIVLPAGNAAGTRPTCFEHPARLAIDARLSARTTLARQRVGGYLRPSR